MAYTYDVDPFQVNPIRLETVTVVDCFPLNCRPEVPFFFLRPTKNCKLDQIDSLTGTINTAPLLHSRL